MKKTKIDVGLHHHQVLISVCRTRPKRKRQFHFGPHDHRFGPVKKVTQAYVIGLGNQKIIVIFNVKCPYCDL